MMSEARLSTRGAREDCILYLLQAQDKIRAAHDLVLNVVPRPLNVQTELRALDTLVASVADRLTR